MYRVIDRFATAGSYKLFLHKNRLTFIRYTAEITRITESIQKFYIHGVLLPLSSAP